MRIISYLAVVSPSLGVLSTDTRFAAVHDLDPACRTRSTRSCACPTASANCGGHGRRNATTHHLADVHYAPCRLEHPHAFWALALNFKTHIVETGLTTSELHPQIFLRVPASFVPAEAPLVAPPPPELARAFDYEGELGVIIGRGGRHIPVDRALEHVAGYTVVNEGSVREFQRHNRQFGLGKNFESASGSYGPWMMTSG